MQDTENSIGEEILGMLRDKARSEYQYYNPRFLSDLTELINRYYDVEDDEVDEWVSDMFSA